MVIIIFLQKGLVIFEKRHYIEKAVCHIGARAYIFSPVRVKLAHRREEPPLRFVYPNLVYVMRERDLDYKSLAVILGISEHAAYRRLRGFAVWKLPEIVRLCQYFGVSDTAWLFRTL